MDSSFLAYEKAKVTTREDNNSINRITDNKLVDCCHPCYSTVAVITAPIYCTVLPTVTQTRSFSVDLLRRSEVAIPEVGTF